MGPDTFVGHGLAGAVQPRRRIQTALCAPVFRNCRNVRLPSGSMITPGPAEREPIAVSEKPVVAP
jgi:hypothetical protein